MAVGKVGIIGSGDVGQALGTGFASRGVKVMIGTREPGSAKLGAWKQKAGAAAQTGSFAEATAFGELVVLATAWSGTKAALDLAGGPRVFAGKVLIDATNPLAFSPGKLPTLAVGHTDSGGEQVQRWLPDAKVVKGYNTVGHAHMVDPRFPGGPPDMPLCGNDAEAKVTVAAVCESFGWQSFDLGGIEAARYLEPLAIVWVHYGLRTGTWNHAFKLLRK
jgi:8-hydroxy-5-deazaflavin:NADPH oxidoreductase